MLIKRIYEVDPLSCPEGGGQMQVDSFIGLPADVVEAILTHSGLWESRSSRVPSEVNSVVSPCRHTASSLFFLGAVASLRSERGRLLAFAVHW